MKNDILKLFNSENNFSRLGRSFIQQYSYLFNKKDYLSKLRKVLIRREEKNKRENFKSNNDIFNSTSNFSKNIFDINYENDHDKIIEKQMKKYLDHKNNYKFHSFHMESNRINSKKLNNESCKLNFYSTLDLNNDTNSFINNKKYFFSFDKMNGRDDIKTNKNNQNINNSKITKIKKVDITNLKKNNINNNSIKHKNEKENNHILNKNELFQSKSIKNLIGLNNFPSIQSYNHLSTIENNKTSSTETLRNSKFSIKKILLNDKLKKRINSTLRKKYHSSLDNSTHIRGINFSKMLSRKTNQIKKSKEIGNIYCPLTPKYDSIYPKNVINFIYKEKIPRKDFHSKYRKYDNEFFCLDLDKVYNKYNNHREIHSFSFDKTTGRKKLYEQNNKEEFISERKIDEKKLNENITDFFNLCKKDNPNSNNHNNYGYNARDDLLENIYKKLIKNLLNKEKKTVEEARLNQIVTGNKINSSYKKLLNIFIKYPIINEINTFDFS